MIVYDCENDDLEQCLEFTKRTDMGRVLAVSLKALKMKAYHVPKRKKEIFSFFHPLLDYLVANNDETPYSEEYYRIVCEEAVELDSKEFENKLKFFFDHELFPPYEYESFEELKDELVAYFKPEMHQLKSTEERFSFFAENAVFHDFDDDYDFDESYLQNFNSFEETTGKEPGRNDPCPCGSGKKYKKCCMS